MLINKRFIINLSLNGHDIRGRNEYEALERKREQASDTAPPVVILYEKYGYAGKQ